MSSALLSLSPVKEVWPQKRKKQAEGAATDARPKRKRSKKLGQYSESAVTGAEYVRNFLADHVPEDYALEEKKMFGMSMHMVRGNMFIGFGMRSEKLLVRVGEEAVEATLAAGTAGVSRCGSAGRVFRGTLMIEPEEFANQKKLQHWFELAMTYNKGMEAKEPGEKARKKKNTGKATTKRAAAKALPKAPPPKIAAAAAATKKRTSLAEENRVLRESLRRERLAREAAGEASAEP